MNKPNAIFNRQLVKMRRELAARSGDDFLKRELCEQLADRLEDMARDFPLALDLGCHGGQMQQVLRGRGGIHRLIQCDISEAMLHHAVGERLVADEEALPFADASFDLVMSAGSLHHVNDLPGCLAQIRRILTPDGLFLGIMPGPQTLQELRESFAAVEARQGLMRPHIAPFVEVRDAGNLLSRAGFALPVVDHDVLTLTYNDPLALMRELKAMGEANMLLEQEKGVLPRALFPEVCAHYQQHYPADGGRVNATMELIILTAWAPHESQQQPAKRGSGEVSLRDILS